MVYYMKNVYSNKKLIFWTCCHALTIQRSGKRKRKDSFPSTNSSSYAFCFESFLLHFPLLFFLHHPWMS